MSSLPNDPQQTIDTFSQLLARRRKVMVSKLQDMAKRRGAVLFEGEWLTPKQVKKAYWRLRRSGWVIFLELLGLFLLMGIIALMLGLMLTNLTGLKP